MIEPGAEVKSLKRIKLKNSSAAQRILADEQVSRPEWRGTFEEQHRAKRRERGGKPRAM
jgi:hypothetical protein